MDRKKVLLNGGTCSYAVRKTSRFLGSVVYLKNLLFSNRYLFDNFKDYSSLPPITPRKGKLLFFRFLSQLSNWGISFSRQNISNSDGFPLFISYRFLYNCFAQMYANYKSRISRFTERKRIAFFNERRKDTVNTITSAIITSFQN